MTRQRFEIEPGALPWFPNHPTTTFEVEYDRYDRPLMGVVRQRDVDFLFRCISGELEQFSVWKYVALDQIDRELLDSVAGDVFAETAASALTGGGTLAVSLAGYGLVASCWYPGPLVASDDAMRDLMGQVDRFLDGMRDGFDSERQRLSQRATAPMAAAR